MSNQKITELSSLSQNNLDPANDLLLAVDVSNTSMSSGGTNVKISPKELVGGSIGSVAFEAVSKNLLAYPFTINYSDGQISSLVYTLPGDKSITKTINYTGDKVTSIVLSGDTPSGISLTKTISYSGDNVSNVSYS